MKNIVYTNSTYVTGERKISLIAKLFPSLHFYSQVFGVVYRSSNLAQCGQYDGGKWADSSYDVLSYLENVGVRVNITGIEHIKELDGPCVIVGNHMSFLETMLLPIMVQPIRRMTFVVKESLLEYPVFKHVMRSRNPIAVSRTNPRQDLKVVMGEGCERIENGISIVVFPQTTRSHSFDPKQMSTIGVKLAKRADVPIVPLAVKTDAMRNGTYFKDFGRIDRSREVHFAFAEPRLVDGRGGVEQQAVNAFIERKLQEWNRELTD